MKITPETAQLAIKPREIIGDWKAHFQSQESAQGQLPEFHYARALHASLDGLAGIWREFDEGQYTKSVVWGKYGLNLEIYLDILGKDGKPYRLISVYDEDAVGPHLPPEEHVSLLRKFYVPASSVIVVSTEVKPHPFLLNVDEPRSNNPREAYGHVWTAKEKFVPDFFGRLSWVDVPKMESVVGYIESLKQTLLNKPAVSSL